MIIIVFLVTLVGGRWVDSLVRARVRPQGRTVRHPRPEHPLPTKPRQLTLGPSGRGLWVIARMSLNLEEEDSRPRLYVDGGSHEAPQGLLWQSLTGDSNRPLETLTIDTGTTVTDQGLLGQYSSKGKFQDI